MQRQKMGFVVRDQRTKTGEAKAGKAQTRPLPLDAEALKQVSGGKSTALVDAPHGKW